MAEGKQSAELRKQIETEVWAFAREYAGTEWDDDPEWMEVSLDSLRRLAAEERLEEMQDEL